ncbi:PspA/IM30 family protein [Virgibacillus sp. W0430]|uniref:PspA/IM30 family protein n=1 Tax=Virgibacillus sp. W0430 TaxID=3391580 RepID=UPI003F46CA2C
MTTLFTRIKDTLSADLHNLLDNKEQNDPIKALNNYLRQSELETVKVKKLVERQYRLKEEFSKEYLKAQDIAEKRLRQANIAEKAKEEQMQAYAMREYEDYQQRADRMKASREEAITQLALLEEKYEKMKYKIKDMRLKRMELMGRENIIRANEQMNRVIEEASDKPYSRFHELEKFIENLETKVNNSYYRTTFDQKIAQLEREMEK